MGIDSRSSIAEQQSTASLSPAEGQKLVPLEQCEEILVARAGHCIGCRACARACSMGLLDKPWTNAGIVMIAPVCRNCSSPRCLAACKRGAMRKVGIAVIVEEALCIGCGMCASACPFGAISTRKTQCQGNSGKASVIRPIKGIVKCDRCRDRHSPACCKECPTGVLGFVSGEELRELIRNSVTGARSAGHGNKLSRVHIRREILGKSMRKLQEMALLTFMTAGWRFLHSFKTL